MVAPGHGAACVWLEFSSTAAGSHPTTSATRARMRSAIGVVSPTTSAAMIATVVPSSSSRKTQAVAISGS